MRDDSTPSVMPSNRRVAYVAVACEVCGVVRDYPPGEVRRRGVIRFCSVACRNEGQRRADTLADVPCSHCGTVFRKRRDLLTAYNYCSVACAGLGKRRVDARWRDPEQIKQYMSEYVQRTKARHNERGREWAKANRDKRNANQQARRAKGQGRGYLGRLRAVMVAEYGDRCLCCGTDERVEIDHVTPKALGGSDDVSNLQPLCRTCNARKNDSVIDYRKGQ